MNTVWSAEMFNISLWLPLHDIKNLIVSKDHLQYITQLVDNQYYWKLKVQCLYANCKELYTPNVNWKKLYLDLETNGSLETEPSYEKAWQNLLNVKQFLQLISGICDDNSYMSQDEKNGPISYIDPNYILVAMEIYDDWSIFNNLFLIKSCKWGFADIVEILLEDNNIDPICHTNLPLYIASSGNHLDVVKVLMKDSRVDPTQPHSTSIYDRIPLDIAAAKHNVDVFKELLKCDKYAGGDFDEIIMSCAWDQTYGLVSCDDYHSGVIIKGASEILSLTLCDPRVDANEYLDEFLLEYENPIGINGKEVGVRILNLILSKQNIQNALTVNQHNKLIKRLNKVSKNY